MGQVIAIDNPVVESVPVTPDAGRAEFVAYIAELTEAYLNGDIDVLSVGVVDQMGIPHSCVGPFPIECINDVLALGVVSEHEAKHQARDVYAMGNQS